MTGFMLYQKLNGKWRDDKMSDKYQNTELIPEERAAYLLEELSLDEKVAQLNCVFPLTRRVMILPESMNRQSMESDR